MNRYTIILLPLVAVCLFLSSPFSFSQGVSVELVQAFPGLRFTRPVDFQSPRDGSSRLFVVEQAGRILVFPNDPGVSTSKVFLDIRDRVNSQGNEEGLLGLAFHPGFAENKSFFVNYTAANPRRTVVSRFRVRSGDPDQADPASEEVIITIPQPYSNHNGGQIQFGPDGFLYIGMGDGGSGGDPQNNGQNRQTLLGAMLRIDVDRKASGLNYAIPPGNPYVGNTEGWREEIFAYGLRNPWRFSFDPVTGVFWCADVGQNKIEEIDIIEKGKNYGWKIMEGNSCYGNPGCDTTGLTLPIKDYTHALGRSITGGYVYRGAAVPELNGAYIYADFVSGRLWSLRYENGKVTEDEQLLNTPFNIPSFGVDENNELYILAFNGRIYRFKSTTTKVDGRSSLPAPSGPEISAVFPNPVARGRGFDVVVRLRETETLRLELRDTLGRRLFGTSTREFHPGTHRTRIPASHLPRGTYFLTLSSGADVSTRIVRMQ